jgi:hypothetical protein
LKGRGYLHVEPSQKSRSHLREKLGELLNHWTLGRSIQETVEAVNRVLRGWAGYFHLRQQCHGDESHEALQPKSIPPLALAQTRLSAQPLDALPDGAVARTLWTL